MVNMLQIGVIYLIILNSKLSKSEFLDFQFGIPFGNNEYGICRSGAESLIQSGNLNVATFF
jgi:hypothetical protein